MRRCFGIDTDKVSETAVPEVAPDLGLVALRETAEKRGHQHFGHGACTCPEAGTDYRVFKGEEVFQIPRKIR